MKVNITLKDKNNNEIKKQIIIPNFAEDMTNDDYLTMQKLQLKAEMDMAKELDIDLKKIDKQSDEYQRCKGLASVQANQDILFYVLNREDNTITKEQVKSLTLDEIGNLTIQLFGGEPENFRNGDKTPTQEQPKKK